jgi:hypothetical protein
VPPKARTERKAIGEAPKSMNMMQCNIAEINRKLTAKFGGYQDYLAMGSHWSIDSDDSFVIP